MSEQQDPSIVAHLQALVRRAGRLEAPSVGLLRPEIRSGDKFLLRDPFAGKASTNGTGAQAGEWLEKEAVGAIVIEWGFDVAPANLVKFMEFLTANEGAMLDARPRGVRYRGTYSVFSSTEKRMGQFRTVWSYRTFGDLNALSDEFEQPTPFATLVKQLRSFADESAEAGRSQQIYLLAASSRPVDL
jgi:hypothetical protein